MNQEITWLLQEKYRGVKSEAFNTDCARLADGEPLGYLIGHVPFLDCTIHLDSHPLIPRVETEFWVDQAIKAINLRGLTPKILDLCAGSGAIGVAVAGAVPEAAVTFAEIDSAHLPTIEKNLSSNIADYPNRLGYYPVVESDIFSNITGTFDFILSNPPYIDEAADTTDESVTLYEPHGALFGGRDGLELIERIITAAPRHLAPNGQLWIEHEPAHVEAIKQLALQNGFSVSTHEDQYHTSRYSILTLTVAK